MIGFCLPLRVDQPSAGIDSFRHSRVTNFTSVSNLFCSLMLMSSKKIVMASCKITLHTHLHVARFSEEMRNQTGRKKGASRALLVQTADPLNQSNTQTHQSNDDHLIMSYDRART